MRDHVEVLAQGRTVPPTSADIDSLDDARQQLITAGPAVRAKSHPFRPRKGPEAGATSAPTTAPLSQSADRLGAPASSTPSRYEAVQRSAASLRSGWGFLRGSVSLLIAVVGGLFGMYVLALALSIAWTGLVVTVSWFSVGPVASLLDTRREVLLDVAETPAS